jgi:hypothetical protein
MDMNAITGRLMRVLRFDASVYREIAADNAAMPQAGVIVTVAVLLGGLANLVNLGVVAYLLFAVIGIVGFFIYAAVATGIAKMLFQGKTDFQEMGRTLGYSYVWYALGALSLVAGPLAWAGSVIAWVAGVIALRESAEFDTVKAVVTVLVSGLVAFFLTGLVTAPLLLMLGLSGSLAR